MVKFGEKKIAKGTFYAAKKNLQKIGTVNVDIIAFSKLNETKTNSKYLNWNKTW